MQTCTKCHMQSPDNAAACIHCQADLREWSQTNQSLKRLQTNPRVTLLKVVVALDCCPACRAIEGAYAKEVAPRLPVEGCSHSLGCRCFYQPVLDEIYP